MIVQSVTRHLGRAYLYVTVDQLDPGVGTWRIAGFDRERKIIALEPASAKRAGFQRRSWFLRTDVDSHCAG